MNQKRLLVISWILVVLLVITATTAGFFAWGYQKIYEKLVITNQEMQSLQQQTNTPQQETDESNDLATGEESTVNWDNYRFEMEDVTYTKAAREAEEEGTLPISREEISKLFDSPYSATIWKYNKLTETEEIFISSPADTAVWKIDKKTGEREIFIPSTKIANNWKILDPIKPIKGSEEILKLGHKLYFYPYNPGVGWFINSRIWELDLNNKKFKELSIGDYSGGRVHTFSPDNTKILSTLDGEEKGQILRILDLQKDTTKIIASTSGDKSFGPGSGYCGIAGSYGDGQEWIDNNTIKASLYQIGEDNPPCIETPIALEENIINLND